MQKLSWVEFYIGLALAVSKKSKDTTKHGCIITNKKNKILGLGFNGPPAGFPDDEMPTHREMAPGLAPNKYDVNIHAEVNAEGNCSRKIKKGIAYVSGIACGPCLIHLYQHGVRKVYMLDRTSNMLNARSKKVFDFVVEKSQKSKYGKLEVFVVRPNLSWLKDLGEEVDSLVYNSVMEIK
jgi:dCMP deaminase